MYGSPTVVWLNRIALLVLVSLASPSAASAQAAQEPAPTLDAAVRPGMTVWVTYASGREDKARVVDVSADRLTTTAGRDIRHLATADVVRVRVRRPDSVLDGALIGAGVAVASGLLLCRATEPWRNCRDDVGPMLRIGAVGAGIGIAVDAVIRGRRTIYQATPSSARLHVAPILAAEARGVRVSISF